MKYLKIEFDPAAYNLIAIEKAAYRGSKFFTSDIQISNNIICTLTACANVRIEDFNHAVEEFKKNVLDYQLREKIKIETQAVRNLILGLAFSKTELIDE